MKNISKMIMLTSFIAFVGCRDSEISAGRARFANSSVFNDTALLSNKTIGVQTTGYGEIEVDIDSHLGGENFEAGVMVRHDSTGSNHLGCSFGQVSSAYVVSIRKGATAHQSSSIPTPALTGNIYGCSVEETGNNSALVKAYINRVVVEQFEFAYDGTIPTSGRFGFGGYANYDNVGVKSFKFSPVLP